MEANKALLFNILAVALILSLTGERVRVGSSLVCCDDCQYGPRRGRYTCADQTEMEKGCTDGCEDCDCDPTQYPACTCRDALYTCPIPCSYYYGTGRTPTAASGEGAQPLRA